MLSISSGVGKWFVKPGISWSRVFCALEMRWARSDLGSSRPTLTLMQVGAIPASSKACFDISEWLVMAGQRMMVFGVPRET